MSILPWQYPDCASCGTPFPKLPTQTHTLCKDCRPVRRNPPVRRRQN